MLMVRRWLMALGLAASLMPVAPAAVAQTRELPDFADLVERTGPAVVNIRTSERVKATPYAELPGDENDPFQEFFRRFLPPRQGGPGAPGQRRGGEEVPRGVGSGFIISADGYILTNHHVVDGADDIVVTLTDRRELKAKLIGSDRRTDVAVVKVDGVTNLPVMKIGDPSRVRVGEWVIAIGSPFGLENTVTAGIVSAKGRDTGDYLPFIQTDVAVNPGNSGGPLLNMRGEVIGINSQIYSRTGGFMGISFAIPIDEATRVADQLRANGKVTRGRIGVGIAEVTKDVAEAIGLQKPMGALIRSVDPGGPAELAGVEAGDIILKFDGKPIEKSSDLPRLVGNTRPGSKIGMQVWRKGTTKDVQVTVVELDERGTARAQPNRGGQPGQGGAASNWMGLGVSDLNAARKAELKIKSGVLVETVDGAAARSGLRPGDIILSLNNVDMNSAKQFNEAVAKLDKTRPAVVLVRRGDGAAFVPIRPMVYR